MKPAPFEYVKPQTIDEALEVLAERGSDAKVLAGGQSLVPLMNFRLVRPQYLIDINGLADLGYVRQADGGLAIGALTRQSELLRSSLVKAQYPLLAYAAKFISHPAIRNRGTVGGSVAHADPAAELPGLFLALDAEFTARSTQGERKIPVGDLFVTYFTTSLDPTELLTEVRVPALAPNTGWGFEETSRRHGDLAVAASTVVASLGQRGVCERIAIALSGVGEVPIRAQGAEAVLVGNTPTDSLIREAAAKVVEDIEPESDVHATADYRRHVATVLTARALKRAFQKAKE